MNNKSIAGSSFGFSNITTPEATFTSIGTVSSLKSLENSELLNLSDASFPTAYKDQKFLFHVHSDDRAYDLSQTPHGVVKNLLVAINTNSSSTLSAFDNIFRTQPLSDPLFYVKDHLIGFYVPEKPEAVVVDLLASLESSVLFMKQYYFKKRKLHGNPIEGLVSMLKRHEEKRRLELIEMMQDEFFPKNGVLLFIIATHFYLLLIQELLSLKDLKKELENFLPEVIKVLKLCAEFILGFFSTQWTARVEGISHVSLKKVSLGEKKKTCNGNRDNSEHFELLALVMDSYRLTQDPIILCRAVCDKESIEAETKKLLVLANSMRDLCIETKYVQLERKMYFPVKSAATWMRASLNLANLSTTEQKVCLTVLHRYSLTAQEEDKEAVYTSQPQTDPVAFHFENYLSSQVSLEVESLDGLQQYLNTLPPASHLNAHCLTYRDGEKTTLVEIACVPAHIADTLRQNKSEFIEKSF